MRDFCTLDLHGRCFAVAFEWLREVIEPPLLTHVPLTPPGLHGVVDLRGELLPVLTLDPFLGLTTPEGALGRTPWMAVFQGGPHSFGVLAGGVGTVKKARVETLAGSQPADPLIEGRLAVSDPKPLVLNFPVLMRRLEQGLREQNAFANL